DSKKNLKYAFNSLPNHIREAISEFELVKKIKVSNKLDADEEIKVRD
ncbi:MAG: hypothetical protein HWN66_18300, partial [Candidatus Helarchaeota archaeon]|nr:hypothetical protein [Candidatus Helarchaeota archaeon]